MNPVSSRLRLAKAVGTASRMAVGQMRTLPQPRIVGPRTGGPGGGGGGGYDDDGDNRPDPPSRFIRTLKRLIREHNVMDAIRLYESHKAQIMHGVAASAFPEYAGALARMMDMTSRGKGDILRHTLGHYRPDANGKTSKHVDEPMEEGEWDATSPPVSVPKGTEAAQMMRAISELPPNVQRLYKWIIAGPSPIHPEGPNPEDFTNLELGPEEPHPDGWFTDAAGKRQNYRTFRPAAKPISLVSLQRYLFGHGLSAVHGLSETLADWKRKQGGYRGTTFTPLPPMEGNIRTLKGLLDDSRGGESTLSRMWLDQDLAKRLLVSAWHGKREQFNIKKGPKSFKDIIKLWLGTKKLRHDQNFPKMIESSIDGRYDAWDHSAMNEGGHPNARGRLFQPLPGGRFWESVDIPYRLPVSYWDEEKDGPRPYEKVTPYSSFPANRGTGWLGWDPYGSNPPFSDPAENFVTEAPGGRFIAEGWRGRGETSPNREGGSQFPFSFSNATESDEKLYEPRLSADAQDSRRASALLKVPHIARAVDMYLGEDHPLARHLNNRGNQWDRRKLEHYQVDGYLKPLANDDKFLHLLDTMQDPRSGQPSQQIRSTPSFPSPKNPSARRIGTGEDTARLIEQNTVEPTVRNPQTHPEMRNSLRQGSLRKANPFPFALYPNEFWRLRT